MSPRQGQVLLSLPWSSPWATSPLPLVEGCGTRRFVRSVDWGVSSRQRLLSAVTDAWSAFRAARGCDAVVVATTSVDAVLLGLLLLARPQQKLAVYDFLLPRRAGARRLAGLVLRRVDVWLVIRRGDAETFELELGARRTCFVPFPAFPLEPGTSSEEDFVYAAGSAHRDWATLVAAAETHQIPTVISTNDAVTTGGGDVVTVLPLLSPAEGLVHMRRAKVVCVPLHDTDLPSGPLVVLDAMSAGKPVVASAVNGVVDYVTSETGVLVPPREVEALGRALAALMSDPTRRRAMRDQALAASQQLRPSWVLQEICRYATAA